MNANSLVKQYDKLSPWERFRLSLAAAVRSDEAEVQRLASTAACTSYRASDQMPFFLAIERTVDRYMLRQLHLAVVFHRAEAALLGAGGEREENPLWQAYRLLAWSIVTLAEGWCLFCNELGVDPGELLQGGIAFDAIQEVETAARNVAFSGDETRAYIRASPPHDEDNGMSDFDDRSPESEAKGFRTLFDNLVVKWGGNGSQPL